MQMHFIWVLFVDDEPDILDQGKIFLEKEVEGLNIETDISAEKALEKLEESSYSAIVSDYQTDVSIIDH